MDNLNRPGASPTTPGGGRLPLLNSAGDARSLSAPGDRLPRSGSAGAASRHASNSSADAHRPGPLGTLPRSGLGSSPPPPQRLSAGAMRRPRH